MHFHFFEFCTMLPDLVSLKSDIQKTLLEYVKKRAHQRLGVFAEAPRHIVHEGERMRMTRGDGSQDDSEMKEASGQLEFKYSDVATLTPNQLIAMLDKMAEQMADKMSRHFFETLNETLDKAGQTVDGRGRPLSAELVLDAFERVQTDFDEEGNPSDFTFVAGPELQERARAAFFEIETNPVLRARRDEIIERKRLAWRDREANRKLVG